MSQGVIASFSVDSRDLPPDTNPSNFTFNLPTSINLPQDRYEMCLARGLIYYAWYNLKLDSPVAIDFTFNGIGYSLTSGNYSILTLEARIKEILKAGGENPDDFNLRKDYPTGYLCIDLKNGATFTPESDELAKMLGFPAGVAVAGTECGDDYPDFEGDNHRIFITHSLVSGNYNYINDTSNRYLYEVKAPERPAFTQFNVVDTEQDFIWFDINSTNIFDMTVTLTDQDGHYVDLHNTPVKYWFLIRPKPNNVVRVYDPLKTPTPSAP